MKKYLPVFFITLLSIAATGCDSDGGSDSSNPSGQVSADQITEEYLANAIDFLGVDPREFPDPTFPEALLDDEDIGDELKDALDTLQLSRDAFELDTGEIPSLSPGISGPLRGLDIIRLTDCACSGWETVDEVSSPGYYSRVSESVCCDLQMTYTETMLGTSGSTTEMKYNGADSRGTEYNDFTACKISVMHVENVTTVTMSGDQNPPEPGPWWYSQIIYTDVGEINGSEKLFTEWTMKSYLYDQFYDGNGGYHPWHQTDYTIEIDQDMTIDVMTWSLNQEKLFLWLIYTWPAEGECSHVEFDEEGVLVSGPDPCS